MFKLINQSLGKKIWITSKNPATVLPHNFNTCYHHIHWQDCGDGENAQLIIISHLSRGGTSDHCNDYLN